MAGDDEVRQSSGLLLQVLSAGWCAPLCHTGWGGCGCLWTKILDFFVSFLTNENNLKEFNVIKYILKIKLWPQQNRLKMSLTTAIISIQENPHKDNKYFFPGFQNNRPIVKYFTTMQVCSFTCLFLETTKIFVLKHSTLLNFLESRVWIREKSEFESTWFKTQYVHSKIH